jgi:hypothetical protein
VHALIDAILAAPAPVSAAWLVDHLGDGALEPLLRRAQVEELEVEKSAEIVTHEYLHALDALRGQWRARRREELAPRAATDPAARDELKLLLDEEARRHARPRMP